MRSHTFNCRDQTLRKSTNYQNYIVTEQGRELILAAYPQAISSNWKSIVDYLNMRSELLDTIELYQQLKCQKIIVRDSRIWIESDLVEEHDLFNQLSSLRALLSYEQLSKY